MINNEISDEEKEAYLQEFLKQYEILIFTKEEIEQIGLLDNCINCGTCTMFCPLLEPTNGELSPRKVAIEVSRTEPYWKNIRKIAYDCTNCGKCEEVCPKSVPIPKIIRILRNKIYLQTPELVPDGYKGLENNLRNYNKSFVPIEEDDKEDYIEEESENLGIQKLEDIYKEDAEIYYFAGCQASERMFKIRESTKFILNKLKINYSLIKNESCCGLPAVLLGNPELADHFCDDLFTYLQSTSIKTLVCTCAGCTARLKEFFNKKDIKFSVKHIVEFLIEDISLEKLKANYNIPSDSFRITLHHPCDLHRGVGKYFIEYLESILKSLPNVEFIKLDAHDECCGAGGLADIFIPDVTKVLQDIKIKKIKETSANFVISACPRCISQIEEGIYAQSIDISAEDIVTFLVKFLKG
ncbi:MAG: (Fe-S)-binding protein [Candidatus Lokiarchaeota archaeon]|nr:(Fe-S)-binding protein [Candidatus Lokiarchaeota archaeon]